jgi:diaminohydroxyphosphoribosylaminopyrimidine deaminase / 5-amino-6-(5-phosphoribosylamino)uracil reductase
LPVHVPVYMQSMMMLYDDAFNVAMMQRCLVLAAQAAGRTAPNPMVGSVVVKAGKIIGEGFHPQAGEPHAEVFALRAAGADAQGATLYVNLEPCNHTGRTPPCTEAILQAGISTVVIGMSDPNPVASGGIARLEAAGIQVVVGVEEAQCRQLNEAFIHRVVHGQCFGILKYAMTLDGKIATDTGHSYWITSAEARQRVHQLRGQCDAIIVGGNTVRRDNPHLTTHECYGHNPLRVVMSRKLALPRAAHLWEVSVAPTLVLTELEADKAMRQTLEEKGVEVIVLENLTPEQAMLIFYERGLLSVLWECGGELAASAIQAKAIQKLWAFIAPKIVGGSHAPTPIGNLGIEQMGEALCLRRSTMEPIGPDWLIQGYLSE